MRAPSTRLAMLAAAVAVLGCNFYDGRAALRVMPEGTLGAASSLALRVESERDLELEILVDDVPLAGSHRTNADLVLGVTELLEGRHVLRVRERGGAGAVESADRALRIDRTPPVASFAPASGTDGRDTPFETTVTFDEPIAPESFAVQALVAALPPGDHVLGVTVSASGTEVELTLPAATYDYRGIHLDVTASDVLGNAAKYEATFWPRTLRAWAEVTPRPANGPVTIQVSATSQPTPERVELWMNGALVGATHGQASPWSFQWDATDVPSGSYPIELRAARWVIEPISNTVLVDHDPPALVRCEGSEGGWYAPPGHPFLSRSDCIRAVFDAEVQPVPGAVVRDGEVVVTTGASTWKSWMESCPPSNSGGWSITDALTLDLPAGIRDPLGNATTEPVRCTLPVPRWLSYWAAPLEVPAGPIVAQEVAGRLGTLPPDAATERALLLWTEPSEAGRTVIRNARAELGEPFAPVGGALNVDPAASASGLVATNGFRAAWIERSGGGPGLVRLKRWDFDARAWVDDAVGPLNRDPARDATALVADASRARTFGWVEEVAGGGRTVEAIVADAGLRPPSLGGAGAIPTAVAVSTLAPKVDPAAVVAPAGPAVAWIERAPDGTTTLRAAVHDAGEWWPAGGTLNLAPRGAVSEPALYAPYAGELWLAWIEDGEVLVRRWAIGATGWTAPEALGSDGAVARSPRFARWNAGILLAFVESRDGADRIEVRARRGDVWTELDVPNGDAGAPIAAFDLGDGLSMDLGRGTLRFPVTWADADGNVTMRVYNGP
jgi:hypothetical protein